MQHIQKHFPNAKISDIKTLFIWSLMYFNGVTILFQSGICRDLQYCYTQSPLRVHVKALCEMGMSSDPHILEGSSVSPSHTRGYISQFPPPTLTFTSEKQF